MEIVTNNKMMSLEGLCWTYSAEEISIKTDEAIAKIEQIRSQINSVSVEDANCENVLLPLAYMEAEVATIK